MKYFYLVYGVMGLRILEKLIESGNAPELIISHKTYNFEKSENDFYVPLQKLAESSRIEIIFTDKIAEEVERLRKYRIGICSGFMEILKPEIYESPEYGILNLHCGKLPEYRGRAPISRSIINGEKELTVTLHKIDSGVDSGDIFLTGSIEITDTDDVNTLYEKCIPESQRIIEEALKLINETESEAGFRKYLRPQEKQEKKANKSISDEERLIKPDSEIKVAYNLVRALYPPYPGAKFRYRSKEYKIENSTYKTDNRLNGGGKIISVSEKEIAIEFKNGILKAVKMTSENTLIRDFRKIFTEGEFIE